MNTDEYKKKKIGVVLMNLGTPDAPTTKAVRRYLSEFLSDPRVVEIPRLVWLVILHGIILRIRPRKSARLYQAIWTPDGSPLQANMAHLTEKVRDQIQQRYPEIKIDYAMRYGNPSIDKVLSEFHQDNVRRLLLIPLYPHYSATTIGSCIDAVFSHMKHQRFIPEMRFINGYADHPEYLRAIAETIQNTLSTTGAVDKVIFSFHGLPKRNFTLGDPYSCFCYKTARLVAEKLELKEGTWQVCFQSRFGKATWLQPYLSQTLASLPGEGVKKVVVVSPGFSCDCLETLEELQVENRAVFMNAGGEEYHYVPALNDSPLQVNLIEQLIDKHKAGWD